MSAIAMAPTAAPTSAEVMSQARSENFPVASLLLGAQARTHLLAIYGFARLVDDIGDNVLGDRGALLDWVEQELDRVYARELPEHQVMRALAPTVRACAMPREPFQRLIAANRQDQVVTRYRRFEDLLDYCQLSAAPVGELVLHVFDAASPERIALSDRVCAGLQVTEHLQDVVEDLDRGRIYLPSEDLERCGASEADLRARAPSDGFTAVMALQAKHARELLGAGPALAYLLPLRPALAVAGFVAGGRAALAALAREGYDVLSRRPRPTRAMFAHQLLGTLAGR
jgi:squalene synthase HpnC